MLTYRDKKNKKNKKNFAYLRKKKFFNNRYVATAVHRQVQVHALNIFLSKKWFGWIIQTFSAFSAAFGSLKSYEQKSSKVLMAY